MTHTDDARLADVLAEIAVDGGTKELFRRLLQEALQDLIEAELTGVIGAAPHERTETRSNQCNGGRQRGLSTPAGDVELRIPKVKVGSFFPSLLEPRRRVDRALCAVIMTAYVHGTSTRKVDDLVRALGCDSGVFEVDRVADLRRHRRRGRGVPAAKAGPRRVSVCVLRHGLASCARVDGRVVSRAVVVATGVAADDTREVLGIDVGDSEDEVFWTAFLATLPGAFRA